MKEIEELFDKCCQEVAKNNRLGTNLVTGHRRTFFNEAALLFAKQIHNNALDLAIENSKEVCLCGGYPECICKTYPKMIDKQFIEKLKIQ